MFYIVSLSFNPFRNITERKMNFFIKYFFAKCDQIRRKLRTWSHLLKKILKGTVMQIEKALTNDPLRVLKVS